MELRIIYTHKFCKYRFKFGSLNNGFVKVECERKLKGTWCEYII